MRWLFSKTRLFLLRKFCTLTLCLLLSGCQTLTQTLFFPNEGIRERTFSVIKKEDRNLVTSDGITLVADLYLPITKQPVPTILVRIPFTNNFTNRFKSDAVARYWASRGYNVVIQGTRGRYKSSGSYTPLVNERDDGIATLAWLKKQPWFDGRLGMWGGSAFGYTQWAIADQRSPTINAYHLHIVSTSFYDMFYAGGAFSLQSALRWSLQSGGEKDVEPGLKMMQRGFEGFPLIEADDRANRDVSFFNDWAENTRRNQYWEQIDGNDRAQKIGGPVQMIAGWYDPFLPSQLKDFTQIKQLADRDIADQSEIIIGPWSHAREVKIPNFDNVPDYRNTSVTEGLYWFDRQLLKRFDAKQGPGTVRLFVMGINEWRTENEWPLRRAEYKNLYLSVNAKLDEKRNLGIASWQKPEVSDFNHYTYNPENPVPSKGGAVLGPRAGIARQNDIEARQDVLVYTSEVLGKNLEVTGPIQAKLYVVTDAKNTDFVVRLTDVDTGGNSYNVSDGILRKDYLSNANSCNHAELISVDLWPTSYVFKAGHRLRVLVTSSSFPRWDRNPNTGTSIPFETKPIIANQLVCLGGKHASFVRLPVVTSNR